MKLTDLNRINLLVGINGSGKSSILELMMGVSKLSQLNNTGRQDIYVGKHSERLHSLFEPETEIKFTYTDSRESYRLKIITQSGDKWQLEKAGQPFGGSDVIAMMNVGSSPFHNLVGTQEGARNDKPFSDITIFDRDAHVRFTDIEKANAILQKINAAQRHFRERSLSSGSFTFENENEIRPEFVAGGTRYIAGLIAAIRQLSNASPVLLVDDLGDELFPAVRKILLPEIIDLIESSESTQFAQMFATTHNIEIVKTALHHPEYCSVYMFDYDGTLLEIEGAQQRKVESSAGIRSQEVVPAIASMLGLTDVDLGFPELVILVEEETKKTFLDALFKNPHFKRQFKTFDVLVPFQSGDGNTSKAVHNLLDLSKYFFYSEIWSDRYAIFVDYNTADYSIQGLAKTDSTRQKALAVAQAKLGHGKRFLLTKRDGEYMPTFEETYPTRLWEAYRKLHAIPETSPALWLGALDDHAERGKAKNGLALYVAENINSPELDTHYPELKYLLTMPIETTEYVEPIILADVEDSDPIDQMLEDALRAVTDSQKASTSMLQRKLRIGYGRAARIIEQLETLQIIAPADGARPRKVLVASFDEALAIVRTNFL